MFLLQPATLVVMLAVAVMVTVGLLLLGRSRRTEIDGGTGRAADWRMCRTPGCGHLNRSGAKFCGLCGKPL